MHSQNQPAAAADPAGPPKAGQGRDLADRGGFWTAMASVVAGLGAFATASCCVLPLAFVTFGLGGTWLSTFDALFAYRETFQTAALSAIGAGWAALAWHMLRRRDCRIGRCAPRRTPWASLLGLVLATGLLAGSWLVVDYQGDITRWLFELRITRHG